MQFVPIPLVTYVRPTVCPVSLIQGNYFFILVMSLALASDFKKYVLAVTLNDLAPS
jgi:hypothetical protein